MGDRISMGIPSNGLVYHKIFPNQDIYKEFLKTMKFLIETFSSDSVCREYNPLCKDIKIQFINYGNTQLVYVITIGEKRFVALVGQPITRHGTVKQEFENLRFLSIKNKDNVVNPISYFSNQYRELYIAPYIEQARCIGNQQKGWGIYIPEPFYRFETFSSDNRSVVNSCMIALLVKMFDSEKNLGIASCKIGGGDFILEKEWSNENLSYDNTLKRMKLIAARELISTNFNTYLDLIEREFSKTTHCYNETICDTSILINHDSYVPMSKEEIENGIEIGIQLRK